MAAAKAEFFKKYEEAAAAAAAAPAEEAEEKAVESRKKRQILMPYSMAPLVAKATVKTSHFEKDDAALTPASTTKIELKEQEHDVYTPFSYPMYQPLYLLRGDRHNCVHNCWRNADLHPYVEFKSVFDFFLSIQYGKKQVHYK